MSAAAKVVIAADTLSLSGVLDYGTVCALDSQGQQWLKGAAPHECKIDLSGVTYSSSVGLALLLGWLRLAGKQNKKLHILHLPTTLVALAKVGGLDAVLT